MGKKNAVVRKRANRSCDWTQACHASRQAKVCQHSSTSLPASAPAATFPVTLRLVRNCANRSLHTLQLPTLRPASLIAPQYQFSWSAVRARLAHEETGGSLRTGRTGASRIKVLIAPPFEGPLNLCDCHQAPLPASSLKAAKPHSGSGG